MPGAVLLSFLSTATMFSALPDAIRRQKERTSVYLLDTATVSLFVRLKVIWRHKLLSCKLSPDVGHDLNHEKRDVGADQLTK